MKANNKIITSLLNTMSRQDLSATAKELGIPCGKSKANTVANIQSAIGKNTVRSTIQFTLRPNTDPTATVAPTTFSVKYRTHKADKLVKTPYVAPVPAPASVPA